MVFRIPGKVSVSKHPVVPLLKDQNQKIYRRGAETKRKIKSFSCVYML